MLSSWLRFQKKQGNWRLRAGHELCVFPYLTYLWCQNVVRYRWGCPAHSICHYTICIAGHRDAKMDVKRKWPPFCRGHFQNDYHCRIFIQIQNSLTSVIDLIGYQSALVLIMAKHRLGDKPLSKSVIVFFNDANRPKCGKDYNAGTVPSFSGCHEYHPICCKTHQYICRNLTHWG